MQSNTVTAVTLANHAMVVDPDAFPVIEWKGGRVVTTETLAKGYGTEPIRIQQNHIRNESRFIEGVHYHKLRGEDLKSFRLSFSESVSKHTTSLILWTEKGAARMSKIVDTDEAWGFFERLEDSYFHPRSSALPQTYEQALEDLLAKVKENRLLAEQRDHAVRTKAWIGEKREATAMATASAAVREKNKLAETVGACRKHATITAVENKTSSEFKWQGLRKWCRENGTSPLDVEDKRFGTVKSWPREAWLAVYGVDLRKLF